MEKLNDIGYPDFVSILFEDGKAKDIENLIERILSIHELLKKKELILNLSIPYLSKKLEDSLLIVN